MFSRLDPLFKAQMRHAETLDTRQGIQRQEKPKSRKKQQEKEKKGSDQDLWQDQTGLSVLAVKAFLEQLVHDAENGNEGTSENNENIDLSQKAREKNERTASDTQDLQSQKAAQAAQAYQRTYRATHEEEQQQANPDAIPDIALRPDEIRIIHQLIKDLGQLAAQGVDDLPLKKSESFLQSLVDAVNDMKN